jgi:hypothetical protein
VSLRPYLERIEIWPDHWPIGFGLPGTFQPLSKIDDPGSPIRVPVEIAVGELVFV